MESLCLSSLPGKPQSTPTPEQKGRGSCAGVRAVTSSSSHSASPQPRYPHRIPGELIFPSAPALKIPAVQTEPLPSLCCYLGFVTEPLANIPILSGNQGTFNLFAGHELK